MQLVLDMHKGLVLEFTGKNDEALELSEKAISLDFAASYYTTISILFSLKRKQEAQN